MSNDIIVYDDDVVDGEIASGSNGRDLALVIRTPDPEDEATRKNKLE